MECKWLDCEIKNSDGENIRTFFENMGYINQMISEYGYENVLNSSNKIYYDYLKQLCDKYEIDYKLYGVNDGFVHKDFYYMCNQLEDLFMYMLKNIKIE